jgi:hypothetical protein
MQFRDQFTYNAKPGSNCRIWHATTSCRRVFWADNVKAMYINSPHIAVFMAFNLRLRHELSIYVIS